MACLEGQKRPPKRVSARDAGFVATGYSASWYVYTVYMLSFFPSDSDIPAQLGGHNGKTRWKRNLLQGAEAGQGFEAAEAVGFEAAEAVCSAASRRVVVLCSVSVARGVE